MNETILAEILHNLLVDEMEKWNKNHPSERQMIKMDWKNLDPVSKELYIKRCERFLKLYKVEKL